MCYAFFFFVIFEVLKVVGNGWGWEMSLAVGLNLGSPFSWLGFTTKMFPLDNGIRIKLRKRWV